MQPVSWILTCVITTAWLAGLTSNASAGELELLIDGAQLTELKSSKTKPDASGAIRIRQDEASKSKTFLVPIVLNRTGSLKERKPEEVGYEFFRSTKPLEKSQVKLTGNNATLEFDASSSGTPFTIFAKADTKDVPVESNILSVSLDNTPPQPSTPTAKLSVGSTVLLTIPFDDDDLDEKSLVAADKDKPTFVVKFQGDAVTGPTDLKVEVIGKPRISGDKRSVELEIAGRSQGSYVLKVAELADLLGNKMVAEVEFVFRLSGGLPAPEKATHVAFPPVLKRGQDIAHESTDFQPEEWVDTRVIRLYYFRDAHRVVEIVNRNLKRLNQSGVSFERDLANQAEVDAKAVTDTRRDNEARAAQSVQRARAARRELDKAQADFERSQRISTDLQSKIEKFPMDSNKPDWEQQRKNADLSATNANERATHARADLDAAQTEEVRLTNDVRTTQAKEDRAREKQFRLEVNAGKADPNTYAAANLDSVDPVTQCSLSVIGEGVIHVRGPVRGINKIARMLHQIDTPVGQVKVGIHTVQVNGEHGDRMELVYERIDKHIAQSRFLAHETAQTFRKAVMQVASEVAASVDAGYFPPGCEDFLGGLAGACPPNHLRRVKYLCAFFGGDFIRELQEMDSELLGGENKLLSIHSMDTLSLSGALYVAAVAKNDVRMRIIQQFQAMVKCDLPQAEFDYYLSLTRIRHPDPCLNGIIMAHFGRKLDAKDGKMIFEKAARTYTFPNFVGFFNHQLSGDDTLNNLQHATIRLSQAMKAQLVAEIEYKNLLLERSLMEFKRDEIQSWYADEGVKAEIASKAARENLEIAASNLHAFLDLIVEQYMQQVDGRLKEITEAKDPKLLADYQEDVDALKRVLADPKTQELLAEAAHRNTSIRDKTEQATRAANKLVFQVKSALESEVRIARARNLTGLMELDINKLVPIIGKKIPDLANLAEQWKLHLDMHIAADKQKAESNRKKDGYYKQLFAKRVLEQSIDDTEEKSVELLEAMRSHVANVDNYLKRLATALEDDINAQ
ncbi:MAG: hypothetical protein HZA46_12875, partial [Planctomycetales bacterium]|nr:hypothetical protein [Planctomycetales bacterium]